MDVTAAIIMKEGQVLIARRAQVAAWQEMGVSRRKVESGESLAACLKRNSGTRN